MASTVTPENLVPGKSHAKWNRGRKLPRPAITEGFVMPGFAGRYYMWPEEYWLLSKYVDLTRGDYLEIGSMCGIIAGGFAKKYPQRRFVCVDFFEAGHATIAGDKDIFLRNVREHNLTNVTLLEGDSAKVVPTLKQGFDIAFIDANHAYNYVLADALNCWRLVNPGGFLAFHDYECVEETTRAVNDFTHQTGARVVEAVSGIAVLVKPDPTADQAAEFEDEENLRLRQEFEGQKGRLQRDLDQLSKEKLELRTTLNSVLQSKGWRFLNVLRDARSAIRRVFLAP